MHMEADIETLDGALAQWDNLLTRGAHYELEALMSDIRAEMRAEESWTRHAENLGWEEALLDSYIDSGFITRY